MRLETLGAVAALAAAMLTVEQRGNASTFGLVLSYALSITMLTSMTVRSPANACTALLMVLCVMHALCVTLLKIKADLPGQVTQRGSLCAALQDHADGATCLHRL